MKDSIDRAIAEVEALDDMGLVGGLFPDERHDEPHDHQWEAAYVLERLFGDAPGRPLVRQCWECGHWEDLA